MYVRADIVFASGIYASPEKRRPPPPLSTASPCRTRVRRLTPTTGPNDGDHLRVLLRILLPMKSQGTNNRRRA
jgi:hypothetical protein